MPKRVMLGTVVNDNAEKTITVRVNRRFKHPLYKKYILRSKNFLAHDEQNACKVGDRVRIRECRPRSKRKCWEVIDGGVADAGRA